MNSAMPDADVRHWADAVVNEGTVNRRNEIAFETAGGLDDDAEFGFRLRGHSCNPLVDAAQPLLALAIRIRRIEGPMDVSALHERARNQLITMEDELRKEGYEAGTLSAYQYCLCSFIDEAVMATPWGSQSEWAQRSLLSARHNETWGGEKFFSILSRLMTQPEHFRDLLEFMYLCLCLGFKGRYQVEREGQESINSIMRHLHRSLRQMRGACPEMLADVRIEPDRRRGRLVRLIPSFSPWIAAALVMAAAYGSYSFHLAGMTAEVLGALETILALPR